MKVLLNKLSSKEADKFLYFYSDLKKKFLAESKFKKECDVCGSDEYTVLGDDVIRLSNTKLYLTESDQKLIVCERCGCVRKSLVFPNNFYFDFLNYLYNIVPYNIEKSMLEKAKLRAQMCVDYLQENSLSLKSVLEISSYDGVTLDYFRNFFKKKTSSETFFPTTIGIEPTTLAVKFAVKKFPHLKGKIINDLVENLDLAKLTFDFNFDTIISSYALRMIVNPKEIISNLAAKLSNETMFLVHEGSFINTNMLSLNTHQLFRQFSQQKINYFTNYGLKYLMESNFFRFYKLIYHDAPNLQGVLMGFKLDRKIKADEKDLKLSKDTSNLCLKYWRNLQKDKKEFLKYLENVG